DVPPCVERADMLLELAITQRGGPRKQIELCDEAMTEAAGDDLRSTRALALRAGAHLLDGDARAALVDARAALGTAEEAGDPALLAAAIAWVGLAETYHAEITPGLLERGLELEERLGLQLEFNHSPRYVFARRLMRLGETDQARAVLEKLEAEALHRGDEGSRVMILWSLSLLEWITGRCRRALDQAVAAHELTEQTQHPHAWTWVGRVKALVEADLGLVDAARASAEGGLAYSRATLNDVVFDIVTLGVLGRLELVLGNLEEAGRLLRDLPARLLAGGINDPTLPVWADAIEPLIDTGDV